MTDKNDIEKCHNKLLELKAFFDNDIEFYSIKKNEEFYNNYLYNLNNNISLDDINKIINNLKTIKEKHFFNFLTYSVLPVLLTLCIMLSLFLIIIFLIKYFFPHFTFNF
jgi:hypothetical protein